MIENSRLQKTEHTPHEKMTKIKISVPAWVEITKKNLKSVNQEY